MCENKEPEKILAQSNTFIFSESKTGGEQNHNNNATQILAAGHVCNLSVQNQITSDTSVQALPGCTRPTWTTVGGLFTTHSPSQLKATYYLGDCNLHICQVDSIASNTSLGQWPIAQVWPDTEKHTSHLPDLADNHPSVSWGQEYRQI